jgi:HSP20 family protein
MEGYFDRYNRLTGDGNAFEGKNLEWRPSADISESKKHYLIKAVLPEVDKEDVQVSIENGILTISGERRYEKEEESDTQHRIESMYGNFSRSFTLPGDVDEQHISAKTKNGILNVRLPKAKEVEPKSVSISVD